MRAAFLLALASVLAAPAARASQYDVLIDEIDYDPFSGDEKDEFVELFNRGAEPVDLSGWSFTDGISFVFPAGLVLGSGAYLVVSPDAAHAKARFGIENVVGNYTGKLVNTGEILTLSNAEGRMMSRVHYENGDSGAWPENAGGLGPTLELAKPYESEDLSQNWASSLSLEGTPGRQNTRYNGPKAAGPVDLVEVKRTIVINEVLPTNPPSQNGFLEIYNRTAAEVDVGGYYLVDSAGDRFRIPSPSPIVPAGFLVFTDAQLGFPLSLTKTRYALLEPDGSTWLDGFDPRSGPAGASCGSVPDGDKTAYMMVAPTPGARNVVALDTRIVVNEVMYHPAFVAPSGTCSRQCSNFDQWIELYNRGSAEVDVGGWSISKGIDFTIPIGTKMPAGGYLLIAADRARFLARYPALDPAKVLGDWSKNLSRNLETINIDDALGNRVEHVKYTSGKPYNSDVAIDDTLAASDWPSGADQPGHTLELTNPDLDNRAGQSWGVGPSGGTPLAKNSVFKASPPPLVWSVDGDRVIPTSTEAVTVSCRVFSLAPLAKVELLWHVDPSGAVNTLSMADGGLSGDAGETDHAYAAAIPPQANATTVAFQVRAQTQSGLTAIVPRSPAKAPYTGFKGPYFLYQVDDAAPPALAVPTYHILMADADLKQLESRDPNSDVMLPCTFIAGGEARHLCGVRVRGKGSRSYTPKSWRLDVQPEHAFHGIDNVNLNSNGPDTETVVQTIWRRADIAYSQTWLTNVVFKAIPNSAHLYVVKEAFDASFLKRQYDKSAGGNLYRAEYIPGPGKGDWTYYGATVNDNYTSAYIKQSNLEENDYSDIIDLCRTFDPAQTPDSQFPARLAAIADVDEWARFFAIQSCISNTDGAIETNAGEDYFLYRVPADSSRLDAGKFLLLPWDTNEGMAFDQQYDTLFRPELATVRRFLLDPAFAPLYYTNLEYLRRTIFSRDEMRKQYYFLSDNFGRSYLDYNDTVRTLGQSNVDDLDSYVTDRDIFYDQNLPASLSAGISAGGAITLVAVGDVWRFFRGKSEPSGGNMNWAGVSFDDSTWESGPTGIGYADGDDATVLSDMETHYTSVYVRKAFTVADPTALSALTLEVDYDDGFVAWLNGVEVARRNAPGSAGAFVAFNAVAPASHGAVVDGGAMDTIDLSSFRGKLVKGKNVLACMVLNNALTSSDLTFIPKLLASEASTSAAGCGEIIYTTANEATLEGASNAGRTAGVKVNGSAVRYDPVKFQWSATVALTPGDNLIEVQAVDGFGAAFDSLELHVFSLARPFTSVSGTLASSAAWTAAGGPYLVKADVVVPAGVKLTIGPGTAVFAQGGASIIVRGAIDAAGVSGQPIVFRAASCDQPFGGIALDQTGTAAASPEQHLRFVDLESGSMPAGFLGALSAVNAKVLIEDCTVRGTTGPAIAASGSRVEVRRTLFADIGGAVSATNSTIILQSCAVQRASGKSDAVLISGSGPGGERSLVDGCTIEDGIGQGVVLSSAPADVRDSSIAGFQLAGIAVDGASPAGATAISATLVRASETGISVSGGAIIAASHDTVAGNQQGIILFTAGAEGGHASFDSSIVWDSVIPTLLDSNSTLTFDRSDIAEAWQGQGNAFQDPLFVDMETADFHLAAGSPAIASGADGTDMGAFPYAGLLATFVRGDADGDGKAVLSDVQAALAYLFLSASGPACLKSLDANDDGFVDIADPIYLLFYLFAKGSPPPAPFPAAGIDLTPDGLPCP